YMVLGALPRDPELGVAARHLGLVPADEAGAPEAPIARAAALVAAGLDIDRWLALARPSSASATTSPGAAPCGSAPLGPPPPGKCIAVACDDAFRFTYAATLGAWRRQGAELSFFSPLADAPPDPAADAVFLPGGYPELHAGRLAAGGRFLAGLRDAAARGAAVYGECGGYMVLGDTLVDRDGRAHRMAGLLPLATSFAAPRRHLGYRRARLVAATPLGPAGAAFRGHEFHYATIVAEGPGERLFAVADSCGQALPDAGLRRGNVAGSFIHLIDREE
ncbi:MAG TPA: cobyrinic acid a,c-diamide synthase, partial [Stellaceae bacterium]|nr:cobyrinic acid a,c-diamide synthase [Stellaceae bacterium]